MEMVSSQGFITFETFLVSEHSSIHLVQVDQLFVPKNITQDMLSKREEMLSLMKNSLFIQMEGVGTEEQEEGVRLKDYVHQ